MIDTRENIQQEAFTAWKNNNNRGTVEIATGIGKTFIAFHAVMSMPKHSNCLFLAETTVREDNVRQDSLKYESIYGVNPLKHVNFKFMCYQSAYKYNINDIFSNKNPTIVILDNFVQLKAI